jgi:electron transport complex protein RnfG
MAELILSLVFISLGCLAPVSGWAGDGSDMKEVFPDAAGFESVTPGPGAAYYKAFDKGGKLLGAVFKVEAQGYAGKIEVMAGLTREGNITNIKVLDQNETADLGSKVAQGSFTGQFRGKDARDLDSVQAVSGATVSSRAVIDAVKAKAEEIKMLIKDEMEKGPNG